MSAFPTPETWLAHRISYGETDPMGVLYYANYFHIFERSRNQFIRERGMSYTTVEERGFFLPVRDASCRYRRPAHYDDLIQVRVGVSEWGRASILFVYEVLSEDNDVLHASGSTLHAVVNAEGRPVGVPVWLKQLF